MRSQCLHGFSDEGSPLVLVQHEVSWHYLKVPHAHENQARLHSD